MTIKPLVIKVSAGLIGAGGAGGAVAIGYQGYKAIQNKPEKIKKISNKDKLTSEKYEMLGQEEGNSGKWTEILTNYKKRFSIW